MKNTFEQVKDILENQSLDREEIKLSDLPSPSLIPNLSKAAVEIISRLDKGQKMLIVGDYDCDGIMATTIKYEFYQDLGYGNLVDYIVPDRFIDGYGVSKNMVDYAIDNMFNFIVTVDNGIGAAEAIDYAIEQGISVIITDHHTVGKVVPNADIIVNLKYEQGDFPFLEISGATIAWYLCAEINKNLGSPLDMKKWLDLVGITVISDVMPLKSLNVSLAKYAVSSIKNKKRYLYELIFPLNKREVLTETDIAFGFVPMINAVGRLDHAKNAIEILLSKDKGFVRGGFTYLKEVNNRRKNLTQDLLNDIQSQAEEQANNGAKAIIVRQEGLHEGIVGILAGKLAERYMRPAYVFGWNHAKNCWKGSGRTSGVVSLYNLTVNGRDNCIGFGGHAGAVGVAINTDQFEIWTDIIMKAAQDIKNEDFLPLGEKPISVSLSDINFDLMSLMDSYRPYGEAFPMPLFKANVYLSVLDSYTEGLHWKCLLIDSNGNSMNAWLFHDKGVVNYNNQEVEVLFSPVRTTSTKGKEIEIHATINYLGV